MTCSQSPLSSSVRHARRRKAKAKERAVCAPMRAKPSDTSVGGRGAGAGVTVRAVEREGGGGTAAFVTAASGWAGGLYENIKTEMESDFYFQKH